MRLLQSWKPFAAHFIHGMLLLILIQGGGSRNTESEERIQLHASTISSTKSFSQLAAGARITQQRQKDQIKVREPLTEPDPNEYRRHQVPPWSGCSRGAMKGRGSAEAMANKVADMITSGLSLWATQTAYVMPAVSGCAGAISEAEYQALQDLYLATGGANWTWHNSSSSGDSQWVFPSNLTAPCSDNWEGVYCELFRGPTESNVSCAVTGLVLPLTNLRGQLPASIGNLLKLEILELQNNQLEGQIQSMLCALTALTLLDLNANKIAGTIPSCLGGLTALTELGLYENLLSGTIPSLLGNLTALILLGLNNNSLAGPIPTSLSFLTALTELGLDGNRLTGTIPYSLGNLTALAILGLNRNMLTGPIPSSLGNLMALTELGLFENRLTGPIPSSLGYLRNLTILGLNENSLTGSIPSSLGNLPALTILSLNENSLTESVPTSLGYLTELIILDLYEDSLTGFIPSSLANLAALTILGLFVNSLTGTIPSSLGNLIALRGLGLYENSLTGSIPSSFGNLNALTQLSLSSNSLVGTIPSSLGSLEKCFYVNMSSNSLTGVIPAELGNVGSNLSVSGAGVALDLSQNALSGTLSPLLFSDQLQTILLYSNCMQGSLPAEICLSSNLQTLVLDKLTSGSSCQMSVPGFLATFATTTLQRSIPDCVWSMPMLQRLHLSGNGLHGTLGDIGSISPLVNVDLSNNFLNGAIPISIQTQQSLQQLDLANNKLSGILSPSFIIGNLTLLSLTVNRLSGDIPASFVETPGVTNFSILTGNLFACGRPLPASDPASSSYVCGSLNLDIALYICGGVLLVVMLMAVSIILYLARRNGIGNLFVGKLPDAAIDFLKQYSACLLKAANLRHLIEVVDMLKGWLCALGLCYLTMSISVYVVLKSVTAAGILAEQYTWVTTSAFLHDYTSAALIGLCALFSDLFLGFIARRLDFLLLKRIVVHSLGSSSTAESKPLKSRYVLQRLLIQIVSHVIVLVANVLYVYGVVFGRLSSAELLLTQIALGLSKLIWQQQFVTRVISWIADNHDDISVGGLLFHQVVMNVTTFVVAPYLATLGTHSDCLYYAVKGIDPISSSFNIKRLKAYCFTTTYSNGKVATVCTSISHHRGFIPTNAPLRF